MNPTAIDWTTQIFLEKANELQVPVAPETIALFRSANSESCARLQAHPRAFLRMKAQLRYWIERHAEVAALLATRVAKAQAILPGHYADAVSVVSAWKPAVNGTSEMAPTSLCPLHIHVHGRVAMKSAAA